MFIVAGYKVDNAFCHDVAIIDTALVAIKREHEKEQLKMSDETLELLWSMLTNEQLLELREKGAMDDRTMASFKTELFKRCLIQFDETADAVAKAVMAAFMEGLA